MYGLFVGLVFGYPYALIFSPSRGLLYGLVVGLFNTVIFTVLNGLVFGVLIERACDFCKASVPEGDHLPFYHKFGVNW